MCYLTLRVDYLDIYLKEYWLWFYSWKILNSSYFYLRHKDSLAATGCKLTLGQISQSYRATFLGFVFSKKPFNYKRFWLSGSGNGREWAVGIQPWTEAFKNLFSQRPGETGLRGAISNPWSHALLLWERWDSFQDFQPMATSQLYQQLQANGQKAIFLPASTPSQPIGNILQMPLSKLRRLRGSWLHFRAAAGGGSACCHSDRFMLSGL